MSAFVQKKANAAAASVDLSKKKKDVRFPLLFEASEQIQDEFWKNVLIDLSRGRCLKKITVDYKTLFAGTKRNQLVYFYADKTPAQIASELPPLLRKYLSLYSQYDLQNQAEQTEDHFNDFLTRAQDNNWKKIKNKKMKQSLLVDYTLRCKEEWNLNWNQSRELLKILEDAFFVYRTHSSEDVEMENGEIIDIEDIGLQNGVITNPRYSDDLEQTDEEDNPTEDSIQDTWCQYIRVLADELT